VLKEGKVNIIRKDRAIDAQKGMELLVSDVINTFERSKAKIIFEDNTVVTLGKNSRFALKEYLFGDEKSRTDFSFTKGFFQVVTGKIGKMAPERFKIKTRTSTIGIRGTTIEGFISRYEEVISCLSGAIWVEANGKRVDVNEGQTTIIKKGAPPTPPKNFLIKKGLDKYRAEKFDESYAIFQKLIETEKKNPIFYYYFGKSAYMLEKYDIAIEAFESVIRLDKENIKGHYELGMVFYTIREFEKSIEEFEFVLEKSGSGDLKETYTMSLFWLGKIYSAQNKYKKAEYYFKEVLKFELSDRFKKRVLDELQKLSYI